MGMKYVAAYLLSALSGKDEPSEKDVKSILEAASDDVDSALVKKLVDGVKGTGKPIHELISANLENLKSLGGGGGGGAAPTTTTAADNSAPTAAAAPVEEE